MDKLLLGREFPDVHLWMDEPYRWLGKRHRILRHDTLSVLIKYCDDPVRLTSALLHIACDKADTSRKRRFKPKKLKPLKRRY